MIARCRHLHQKSTILEKQDKHTKRIKQMTTLITSHRMVNNVCTDHRGKQYGNDVVVRSRGT